MRNFLEAENILHTMDVEIEFTHFWNEIKKLMDRIRENLTSRQENNIVIY